MRPLTRNDLPAILALCREALRHDTVTEALLVEKIWGDPAFDPQLALLQTHGDQPAALAVAVKRGTVGYIKLMATKQGLRGMGYGGKLLQELEQRLGTRTIRLAESAPNYWWPGMDVRYTGAMIFFERHGYRKCDMTYNLSVDLAKLPEDGLRPTNIQLRRAIEEDRPLVHTFLKRHWPSWADEVNIALANTPITLHLGFVDGDLAGFAAHDCNNIGTGWFGPMGTSPIHRGNGIGRGLLLACLNDQRAQGLTQSIIPWVGPVAFYHRAVDAEIYRVFFRYEKTMDHLR